MVKETLAESQRSFWALQISGGQETGKKQTLSIQVVNRLYANKQGTTVRTGLIELSLLERKIVSPFQRIHTQRFSLSTKDTSIYFG